MAVLVECLCHKKQSLRNKVCSCGQNLVNLKRSNKVNYWITYRLPGGKLKFEKIKGEEATSLEYARDVEAKRKVQKRENRIFDIKPDTKMTFKELSDWYLGLESVKDLDSYYQITNNLKKFNSVFGNRIVSDIKPSELEDYRAKRKKEGKANSTIDQEVGSAKTAINKAFDDDGLVSGDTLKRFKKVKKYLTGKRRNSNSRKRTLTPMEFKKLVDQASPHIKLVLWMGYDTGMREGEILSLTWGKVFLKDRVIKLRKEDTKDKEAREIPLSEGLCEMLNRLPRGIQENYPVFTYKGKALRNIRAGVTNACKEAGINYGRKEDGFIYHDLRRTFATDMRRAGVAESVIMEITGHSRGEVFDRYNQVNMDDMRQAVEKLTLYRRDQIASVYQNVYQVPNFGV